MMIGGVNLTVYLGARDPGLGLTHKTSINRRQYYGGDQPVIFDFDLLQCSYYPLDPLEILSAAARPKRWGVSRQAKGQEFDPAKFELVTLLP
jgi:hypothetical protein